MKKNVFSENMDTNNISTGDIIGVSGQVAVGKRIRQINTVSTLSASDKKELLNILNEFRKEIPKLDIPSDEQGIVNGKVIETMIEVEKEKPDFSKIKKLFTSAIETIKESSSSIEKVASSETVKKIIELLGLIL